MINDCKRNFLSAVLKKERLYFCFNFWEKTKENTALSGSSIKYVWSKGRETVKAKAYIYCFYDAVLLLKRIHWGKGLKITKFERTYFMDGPL